MKKRKPTLKEIKRRLVEAGFPRWLLKLISLGD